MKRAIKKVRQALLDGMMDYMDHAESATYGQRHVTCCAKILDDFLLQLQRVPEERKSEFILDAVKTVVIQLNDLNQKCQGGLIETDQREQLCELIIGAAADAGLVSKEYDITEKWRAW